MKKFALAIVLLAGLTLSGCSVFYNVCYEDDTKEINEYGMLGCSFHRASPASGPYGLVPFMRDVHVKVDNSGAVLPPAPDRQ